VSSYSHLLVATDFSADGEVVIERAAMIAKHCEARLSIIHVVEFSPLDYGGEQILPVEIDVEKELADRARVTICELAERFGIAEGDQYVETGSTRTEILRVARERSVDLIVVGSHGRRGLALLLGSTANAVLHGAPCDVLAVRVGKT